MNGALVDTGFLVALFRRTDRLRPSARRYLSSHRHSLATVAPVIVETSFFLQPHAKANLLEWVIRGGLAIAEVPVDAYPDIKVLISKYRNRDIDFADAALIWFAGISGCPNILTVDEQDFSIYRIKGNKRFDVVSWTG